MSTLNLKKDAAPPKTVQPPAFDEMAHYGEVYGTEGVKYVQGAWLYNHAKQPVREAPLEMRLAPLTPEQEMARRKQLQSNKKFFGSKPLVPNTAAIPQSVIDAERENRAARAAESQAA